MDTSPKVPRKRDVNFTPEEKKLLFRLIKQRPIIELKLTDGKSIAKKKAAWESVAEEFNYCSRVNKRNVLSLKRAWDNMKSRKACKVPTVKSEIIEENTIMMIRRKSEPTIPTLPHQPSILKKLEETTPGTIPELINDYDSDGALLMELECNISETSGSIENLDFDSTKCNYTTDRNSSAADNIGSQDVYQRNPLQMQDNHVNMKKFHYINRESVFQHFEAKKELEMQILRTQLETEEIKKRSAELEEERNKVLLRKAKLELKNIQNNFKE